MRTFKRDIREPIDRKNFFVDRKTYDALQARLDAPPAPNARLLRTLVTTPPWKR